MLANRFEKIIYFCSDSDNDHDSSRIRKQKVGDKLYKPRELQYIKGDQIDIIWSHMSWDNEHIKILPWLRDQGFKVILTEHSSFWYPYFCAGIGIWPEPQKLKAETICHLAKLDAMSA